jgi:uncharacterized coiled-coil protein SlyX
MTDDRITNLEIKLSFTEDLIENSMRPPTSNSSK